VNRNANPVVAAGEDGAAESDLPGRRITAAHSQRLSTAQGRGVGRLSGNVPHARALP
jgi:hypothetical protein